MLARLGVLLATASSAWAQTVKEAPTACVNREKTEWRQVRDASVAGNSLHFCTGDDCWSYDLVSKNVTAIANIPVHKPPAQNAGSFTGPDGKKLATATETHVDFCTAPKSCKGFDYKLPNPAVNGVYPLMNDEHTLGAVMARAETEAGKASTLLLYDLTTGALIKRVAENDVVVLANGFLIGNNRLFSAKMKKIGKLAVADGGWERVGATNVLALHDTKNGTVVLQDASTAKVLARIDLGATDPTEFWTFAVAPDGNRMYAIGSAQDEGKIVVIDTANRALLERTSPTPCAAGTHRVN